MLHLSDADGTERGGLSSPEGRARRLEHLFADQAAKTPDSVAIVCRGVRTSYAELDAWANRIARRLIDIGVTHDSIVAICLDRSAALVAVVLGVLKAGAAYVPLDSAYPAERLAFMLADSRAAVLVSRASVMQPEDFGGIVFDLDREAASIGRLSSAALPHLLPATAPAYLIYTSGSTGVPKGVLLAHSAVRLVEWGGLAFTPADIAMVAFTTSLCFDPSILEIFVPLCHGGALLVKDDALDPYGADERPTMLNGSPSVIAALHGSRQLPKSLRILNIGGEVLSRSLADALYDSHPGLRIFNHYGPTEATTLASVAPVMRGDAAEPTIGTPVCGSRLYLLADDGTRIDADRIGDIGEIHIAGPNVALGYWGDPARTAARFLPDPFRPGQRMYRTGDLGRFTASGEIAFCGRVDSQIKIRGFRVELGEVDAALMRLPGVRQAAAVVMEDGTGRPSLIAFVAGALQEEPTVLRRHLSHWLPAQSLPARIVELAELPLSPSGKIDRAALRARPRAAPVAVTAANGLPPQEEAICAIFRRHLALESVDPDDDFFDLGGGSLQALNAAVEIEEALGITIPASLFAQYATPRQLARAIRDLSAGPAQYLIPLNAERDGMPLLCAPDFYGRPISFMSIAGALEGTMPVVGLSAEPMRAALIETMRLGDMSRAFRDAIRRRWPTGPYAIAGYSLGATLALDLARTLAQDGEVVHLIMIDGPREFTRPSAAYACRWAIREARAILARHGARELAGTVYRARHLIRHWLFPTSPTTKTEIPDFLSDAEKDLARAILQSVLAGADTAFDGDVLLVRAARGTARSRFVDRDGLLGWAGVLRGRIADVSVDASHYDIIRAPHAASVAEIIADYLGGQVERARQSADMPA